MKHWKTYLEKQKPEYIRKIFPEECYADMVVVIPCHNEPDLFETLDSLFECIRPEAGVLIAIIFNSGVNSDEKVVLQNRVSYEQTLLYAEKHNVPELSFFPLLFEGLPRKHAGVGLARKIGMDIAVRHFLQNKKNRGVIVSLDADCTVSANFMIDIYKAFSRDNRLNATVHQFYHRVENHNPAIENAVRQYENYIRYFREMMKFTGFPYYYHTIGSAFAVSADAYVRVGGMGRQQGGEDFYFLQKVFALGKVDELEGTYVYPMARFSERVPFGTGPALRKILDEPDGVLKVYSIAAFRELKKLFVLKDSLFKKNDSAILSMMSGVHLSLMQFLQEMDFQGVIRDCNANSASLATFRKRFFHHFNAFKIIKYLNYVHPDPFPFDTSISDIHKTFSND
ncbi:MULTISPECIES: glycosyltransferase family A protein [unclassified Proteiniphilum]|jgi:hypothetical protein|uniref:glycosyltransferase family A protein n=1 Tax=unclassified Proteiniphilum TaxID=2622718 RepID=UPI00257FF755|nr:MULTISPECIES: glycosyltransferase family A protein [unclassified Proteiniphilum]